MSWSCKAPSPSACSACSAVPFFLLTVEWSGRGGGDGCLVEGLVDGGGRQSGAGLPDRKKNGTAEHAEHADGGGALRGWGGAVGLARQGLPTLSGGQGCRPVAFRSFRRCARSFDGGWPRARRYPSACSACSAVRQGGAVAMAAAGSSGLTGGSPMKNPRTWRSASLVGLSQSQLASRLRSCSLV